MRNSFTELHLPKSKTRRWRAGFRHQASIPTSYNPFIPFTYRFHVNADLVAHGFPACSACAVHISRIVFAMPFGASHQVLVLLANSAICSFFRTIEVNGSENVPEDVPVIL